MTRAMSVAPSAQVQVVLHQRVAHVMEVVKAAREGSAQFVEALVGKIWEPVTDVVVRKHRPVSTVSRTQ